MNKVWLISDNHFNHQKIIEYCNRPFKTVEQMNEEMIKKWNSVVKEGDKIYHLGDFGFGSKEQIANVVSKLNGRIFLILGNHDNHTPQWYHDAGVKEVYDHPIIIKDFVVLSHAPQPFMSGNNGLSFIYGHIHDNNCFPTWTKNSCCVCVERHNYIPINLEKIIKTWGEINGEGLENNLI